MYDWEIFIINFVLIKLYQNILKVYKDFLPEINYIGKVIMNKEVEVFV